MTSEKPRAATGKSGGKSRTARARREAGAGGRAQDGPAVIRKYANRRLYSTRTSGYVTLDELARMVRDNEEFVVQDARTGEDITRLILTQIIIEQESRGTSLLPLGFLRQLIGFYGNTVQGMWLAPYLEGAIKAFSENQSRIERYMHQNFPYIFPFVDPGSLGMTSADPGPVDAFIRAMGRPPFPGVTTPGGDTAGAAGSHHSPQRQLDELRLQRSQIEARIASLEAGSERNGGA